MELIERTRWKDEKPDNKGSEKCPLCSQDDTYTIWQGEHLKIVHNKYAMLGRDDHLMIIPKRHVILTSDLTKEEWAEMKDAEAWLSKIYAGKNYFSFIRQDRDSRSLEHLHYHYLPGNIYYDTIEKMLIDQGF